MTAQATSSEVTAERQPPKPPVPLRVLFRQFIALAGPFWNSDDKRERSRARWFTAALVGLTICQILVPVWTNWWSADLFDALEAKSMGGLVTQIGVLFLILLSNITITATHLWVKRRIQIGWRRWLTRRLLDEWMGTGRQYQITQMPGRHDNPDGRIAEDIRVTTEAAIDLAHSLFYCMLLLVSFTQILWTLSGVLQVPLGDSTLAIPGHMVILAVAYAIAGTTLALALGRPLVHATKKRQQMEANFRFGLVHSREKAEELAIMHGEADERRRLGQLFRGVEGGWDGQTAAHIRIMLFTSGYSVLSTAFPILVAAPRYIADAITLGALMQTAQAFQQMVSALSWPIDSLSKVSEWRASVERVLSLHNALQELKDKTGTEEDSRIVVHPNGTSSLILRDLCIAEPTGEVLVNCFNAEVKAGERVLICGDPSAAMKLFKVVAGLWSWGHGHVDLPRAETIQFVPERPYLPHAPLRAVLSYPLPTETHSDEQLTAVLHRLGLGHLAARLDEIADWREALTTAEEQRLGFARVLLQRPHWVFLEEATDALEPHEEAEVMGVLLKDLPDITVITVGYRTSLENYHQRKLVLERAADGQIVVKERRVRQGSRRSIVKAVVERLGA